MRKISKLLLYVFIITIISAIPKNVQAADGSYNTYNGYLRRIVKYNGKYFKQICNYKVDEKYGSLEFENKELTYGEKDITNVLGKNSYLKVLENGIIKIEDEAYDLNTNKWIDLNTDNLDKIIRKKYDLNGTKHIEINYVGRIDNEDYFSFGVDLYNREAKIKPTGLINRDGRILVEEEEKNDFLKFEIVNNKYILKSRQHCNDYDITNECNHDLYLYNEQGELLQRKKLIEIDKKISFRVLEHKGNKILLQIFDEDSKWDGNGRYLKYQVFEIINNKLCKKSEVTTSGIVTMSDSGDIYVGKTDDNGNVKILKNNGNELKVVKEYKDKDYNRIYQLYVDNKEKIIIGNYGKYTVIENAKNSGWVKDKNSWHYYDESGKEQTGWKVVNGKWYKFDNSGEMKDNWYKEGNTWYYLEGGAMQTGWKVVNGKWYKFDNSGAMKDNWYKEGNTWYYLEGGAMQTGWKVVNGKWYKFDNSGAMKDNWYKEGNTWYYLEGGAMQTGWKVVNGKWYKFDNSGAMKDNWYKEGNTWYYLESGAMQTGWKKVNNNWYYFNNLGNMVVNSSVDGWKIDHTGIARN